MLPGGQPDGAARLPDASVDLIYVDPPFNTGKRQTRDARSRPRATRATATASASAGQRYRDRAARQQRAYADRFDDYLAFLEPRLARGASRAQADGLALLPHRLPRGALLQGAARRASSGATCFLNEIIWAYDYGGRTDAALAGQARQHPGLRARTRRSYYFDPDAVDRIPYMAPGPGRARRRPRAASSRPTPGGTPSCSPTGKEKPGYPTQKPLGILERIVQRVVARPAASCSTSSPAAAPPARPRSEGRRFLLVDNHEPAFEVMRRRFANAAGVSFQRL